MTTNKWYQKLKEGLKRLAKKAIEVTKKVYSVCASWWQRNRDDVFGLFGAIAAITAGAGAVSHKIRSVFGGSAYSTSVHRVYDPRYGHYWPLRRKPSPQEYNAMHARYRAGEEYYQILSDMHLLRDGNGFW